MPRRIARFRAICILAAAPLCAHAAPLSPEWVAGLRTVTAASLSPDGDSVVYQTSRWQTVQGEMRRVERLWRIDFEGGDARLIDSAGRSASDPRWSPDGSRLAWIARPDADAAPQVYVASRPGWRAKRLTDAPAGVAMFRWSPDGSRIGFTSLDSETAAEAEARRSGRDWIVVGQDGRQRRLYAIDASGGPATLVTGDDLTILDFAWSPDGTSFVIAGAPGTGDDDRTLRTRPWLVPSRGGAARLLARTEGKLTHPVWSGDGRWIGWLASTSVTDPAAGSVFVMPADGSAPPRNLTAGFAGTATWLGTLPESSALVFRAEERQATRLRSVDPVSGEIAMLSASALVLASGPSFSADGRRFAVVGNSPQHPDELYVQEGSADPRRLTRSNPGLESVRLGSQEIFTWRSKDGTPIEGLLIKPPDFRKDVRYPVVLHVHGGSEAAALNGWQASFRNFGQSLATRGFVVLYPNYRGSSGRGVEFVRGNRRDMMGRSWEDIESGLDALVAAGIADGDRAGIYGYSWGGYAAAWGATWASPRFRAAVAGGGIYNWITVAGSNSTHLHEQLAHWDAVLYENFDFFLARSPLAWIGRAETPVLLLHGERDVSCPVGQALEFYNALEWKGVPAELVVYPREGHGFVEYAHQLDLLTRGIAWLERWLVAPPARPAGEST
jgi:dipeptidyl aminopeptidase/acylaminoacyl peptidase